MRLSPLLFCSFLLALLPIVLPAQPATGERALFGHTPDGTRVDQYTLRNRHGATARVITYGAILTDLRMPDRNGRLAGVVREITPSEQGFARGFTQAAAVIGRFANRIAGARFTLDGRAIEVTRNAGAHHIHGGKTNFSRVVWRADTPTDHARIILRHRSPDGDEGFPGALDVSVTYTLTDDNTLRIEYRATSDRPTPINLTNHAYFNLAGHGDVLDHELQLHASRYTRVDKDLIPTGEIAPVAGGHLDFTRPMALGARATDLGPTRRYDHNFVIDRPAGDASLMRAARIQDARSGRVLEVWTTEPGVQLFTSPLTPPLADEPPDRFGFFCLETQHFPDSVNHPHFPSTILRPGTAFTSTTEFRFSVRP